MVSTGDATLLALVSYNVGIELEHINVSSMTELNNLLIYAPPKTTGQAHHLVKEMLPYLESNSMIYNNYISYLTKKFTRMSYAAIADNNNDILSILLKAGVDLDAADADDLGMTLLHKAISKDNLEIVLTLLNAGADPNKESRYAGTPLSYAMYFRSRNKKRDIAIISALLRAGADPNLSFKGTNCLVQAIHGLEVDIIQLLLEYGANPNATDSLGATSLHHAVGYRNITIISTLLKAGADPNKYDGSWHKPIYYSRDVEVEKLLTDAMRSSSRFNYYVGLFNCSYNNAKQGIHKILYGPKR